MKVLLFDNYDSFTYNLVQYLEEILPEGSAVFVRKNDQISLEEINDFDVIFLSPGPGIPKESGILLEVIQHYAGKKPIFGVCLGLQAITEAFGGKLVNLKNVHHGVSSQLKLTENQSIIYKNLKTPIQVGRYHSWVASQEDFPEELLITAEDESGEIMSVKHKKFPIEAVQFHPESILTPTGKEMLKNFINSLKK